MDKENKSIDLTNDKLKSLINSAIYELGKYGVEKASLNAILKNSGSSKGFFYHYFESKEELHKYILELALKLNYEVYEKRVIWEERDVLNRLILSMRMKVQYLKEFPYIYRFIENIGLKEIKRSLKSLGYESTNEELEVKLYSKNVDRSLFREDVDESKLINLANFAIMQIYEKYESAMQSDMMDIDSMLDEMEEYINFIKLGYYNTEEVYE